MRVIAFVSSSFSCLNTWATQVLICCFVLELCVSLRGSLLWTDSIQTNTCALLSTCTHIRAQACAITELCGVVWQVEEIALNMTVLKRWDGGRIWYPNSMINTVPILNVTRSENKWEFFKVSCCTPYCCICLSL